MNEFKEIIKNMSTEQKDKMLFDVFNTCWKGKTVLSNEEKLQKIKSIIAPIGRDTIFK